MSVVVHRPQQQHHCKIERETEARTFTADGREVRVPDWPIDDPPGTVRACAECGRTWVARSYHPMSGYAPNITRYEPEGRIARWWRARRAARRA